MQQLPVLFRKILRFQVNRRNSVLDFGLCAKTKTFKTLTTIERLEIIGNSYFQVFLHTFCDIVT